MGSEDLYKHYSVPVWQCSANYNLGYETVCRGERARAKFSAPFRGIVVVGGGQVVRQKEWLLLGGQPFFFASLVVGRFTDEEMHQCYDQNNSFPGPHVRPFGFLIGTLPSCGPAPLGHLS